MALFDTSPLHQFAKFNDFIWLQLILVKNLSNFVSFPWKLHNQYCHSMYHYWSKQVAWQTYYLRYLIDKKIRNKSAAVKILQSKQKKCLQNRHAYSQVPIKRVGPNKRVGWKFHKKVGPNKRVGWISRKKGLIKDRSRVEKQNE